MTKKIALLFILVLCIAGAAFGQEISEKQEIAVFDLFYSDFDIPNGILGGVDEKIKGVFINMGRFDIIGMTQRLSAGSVEEFIETLKIAKEAEVELPLEVQLGQEIFTEADWNKLVGAFLVVIPTVSYYNSDWNDVTEKYNVTIETTFTFINVASGKATAHLTVETKGTDKNEKDSAKEAMDAISNQLRYEITTVPEFQIKTGIFDIDNMGVHLELGKNMGITVGDEYLIINTRTTSAGRELKSEDGLVVIKNVQEDFSIADILLGDPKIGDQLRELPRLGFEIQPYVHGGVNLLANKSNSEEGLEYSFGWRSVYTRGFYSVRPYVDIEIPVSDYIAANLLFGYAPLLVKIGAEFPLTLRMLQIVPSIGVGAKGLYIMNENLKPAGSDRDFYVTHYGAEGMLNVNLLLDKSFKIFAEAGAGYWFGLEEISRTSSSITMTLSSKLTAFAGAGITLKM